MHEGMKMYDSHGDESGISEMQSKYNSFLSDRT